MQTGQGFSVIYKDRPLYSKYNPARNILSIIDKTEILPGTIILCFSPILQYGLNELAYKLPENCLMFGIESDVELYNMAKAQTAQLECCKNNVYTLINIPELKFLPEKINELSQSGKYRRVISIDFSAGSQINQDFYNQLFEASRNTVSQFWKNRVTLVKFGRIYSSNLIKNLKFYSQSSGNVSVKKPIIVFGAGESSLQTLLSIRNNKSDYFLITVDAALQTFKSLNIKPDAVVCEEAQSVITKAFTGCRNFYNYLFVSSTATNSVVKISPEKNVFYTPLFCQTGFLKKLEERNLIKNPQPPLGSVGLSAVEMALKIRARDSVPIYVTGLDFSYSAGLTHVKMSFHDKTRRCSTNKISPLGAFASAFGNDSAFVAGKDGNKVITTTALSAYAELFRYKYYNSKNLFDAGNSGLFLDIPKANPLNDEVSEHSVTEITTTTDSNALKTFISEEIKALTELKDIFTGKIILSQEEKTKKITALLQNREYLYLHFPDGFKLELSQNFLNRIRIEIDHFLTIFVSLF